jgi:hypothetical protein
VRNLRPATETCEQCHWPEKFHGDKIRRVAEYASDEKNTETITTLQVHVGGGNERFGIAPGIHWHMNIANEIDYVATDADRQVIPYVRLKDRQGNVREYRAAGLAAGQVPAGERRRMDCIDCHNRPSHTFYPSAERAVDTVIGLAEVPRTLPFVRREMVSALKEPYADAPTAERLIDQRLRAFYGSGAGARPSVRTTDIDHAVRAAQRLYATNIFPAMKMGWGSHPTTLGHVEAAGCFRCHDDQHRTPDGRVISQDCELCHSITQ